MSTGEARRARAEAGAAALATEEMMAFCRRRLLIVER
jgi:hypothetical protein